MLLEELLNKLWLGVQVIDRFRLFIGQVPKKARLVFVPDQLPVSLAHRPPISPGPVQGAMERGCVWLEDERKDRVAIQFCLRLLDLAEVENGGKPVCGGDRLAPDLPLGQLGGITDDGGNPQASLVVRALGATPLAGIAAASEGMVVVALFQAALMVFPSAGTILGGVAVVAHEDDEGIFAELVFLEFVEDPQHAVVSSGDHAGIGLSRHRQVLVSPFKFFVVLLGVVRNVESGVEQEGTILVLVDVVESPLGHEIWEVGITLEDFDIVLVEVMEALPVQKEVVVVVDESAEVSEMVVEALSQGTVSFLGSQMPFPKNGSGVACFLENLRDGDLGSCHVPVLAVTALTISLGPVDYPGALWMAPRHQEGPGRTTDGVAVGLGEAHPSLSEAVHGWGVEICRPVAVRVECALIVGKEDYDIGRSGEKERSEGKGKE